MLVNRNLLDLFLHQTKVLWLVPTLLVVVVSDCSWGQTAAEISTLVFSVDENTAAGTEVGALAELYPELNQFRLSNRSRSTVFQVHPDTGVISVRDGAKLDFEKRSTVTLTIVADIREEQDDPYLAEFAESLRKEGFSSKTLSRLIPLEQRIHIQVLVRDVQELDEAAVDEAANAGLAVTTNKPAVVLSVEHSVSEGTQVTPDTGQPETSSPVASETTVVAENSLELGVPVSNEPEISIAEEDAVARPDAEVPPPSDVPSTHPQNSDANGQTLTLSESSGKDALQLNAAIDDGSKKADSVPAGADTDETLVAADDKAAEVTAHVQSTFLLSSLVSLILVLGIAWLLRHRWKSFRKSLPQRSEDQATEEPVSEEGALTADNASPENLAELNAADEFVNEPVHEEIVLQIEHAPQAVIARKADDDHGAPFDPESLIDDDFFNEADDLAYLKARNRELGDRLEARASAAEFVSEKSLPNDNRLTESTTFDSIPTACPNDNPEFDKDSSSVSDLKFTHRRGANPAYNQDAGATAESRWDSDWPEYSEEKPGVAIGTVTDTVAAMAVESKASLTVETNDDKIASLRHELADLFAIQQKAETSEVKSAPAPEVVTKESPVPDETVNKSEPCPEETHQESVAQYLNQLLERSKKEEAADAIFADRRKPSEKTQGKWDGADRRGSQKSRPPVKSYIESYLSEHGGELSLDSVTQKPSVASLDELAHLQEKVAPLERRPVDVQAIRQHMNSFRNVASTSLEHALASHRIRQAKGKVAGRTTLVVGLAVVSVLAITTSSAMKSYFPSLGWLLGLIICLAIAELILRIESIRRHRRELRYRILESAKKAGDRSDKRDGAADDA